MKCEDCRYFGKKVGWVKSVEDQWHELRKCVAPSKLTDWDQEAVTEWNKLRYEK